MAPVDALSGQGLSGTPEAMHPLCLPLSLSQPQRLLRSEASPSASLLHSQGIWGLRESKPWANFYVTELSQTIEVVMLN